MNLSVAMVRSGDTARNSDQVNINLFARAIRVSEREAANVFGY